MCVAQCKMKMWCPCSKIIKDFKMADTENQMKLGAPKCQILCNYTGLTRRVQVVGVWAASTYEARGLEQSSGAFWVSPWFLINNNERKHPCLTGCREKQMRWVKSSGLIRKYLAGGGQSWLAAQLPVSLLKRIRASLEDSDPGVLVCVSALLSSSRQLRCPGRITQPWTTKQKIPYTVETFSLIT